MVIIIAASLLELLAISDPLIHQSTLDLLNLSICNRLTLFHLLPCHIARLSQFRLALGHKVCPLHGRPCFEIRYRLGHLLKWRLSWSSGLVGRLYSFQMLHLTLEVLHLARLVGVKIGMVLVFDLQISLPRLLGLVLQLLHLVLVLLELFMFLIDLVL